jgi:hypothetical protein
MPAAADPASARGVRAGSGPLVRMVTEAKPRHA